MLDFDSAHAIAIQAPAEQYRAVMAALEWPYTGRCNCGFHIYEHQSDCGFGRAIYDDSLGGDD